MLDDSTIIVQSEYIDACPIRIAGPLLVAMQNHKVAFGDRPFKLYPLARILACHTNEVFDESVLAVRNHWIVLNVGRAGISFESFSGLALVKHQVIKGGNSFFVFIKAHECVPFYLLLLKYRVRP